MNIHSIHPLQHSGTEQALEEFGTVLSKTEQGYLVQLESGSTQLANKAFTCTFLPEEQDYVSITRTPNKGLFITHILQRQSAKQAVIEADHDICIRSNDKIHMESQSLNLTNQTQTVQSQHFQQTSETLDVHSKRTHFKAETVDSHISRVMQRVKDSFKIIERMEQVQARDIIQNIKNAFIQRSKQVDMTAKSDVKINGDRIHMG